ncbi:hypothetical protein Pla123a_04720 [Posidoniimonas polymericola]|uniref:Uncharacterized protein n=1 Tax=Posidoniimonas polymericola TaxID=2528002 RepID=A0A5C5ZET0_9BACT|nr:hypothetical protein [Posidoniimonas polymericola]TWT85665.1 hypothetical protein Pla123a_04720 [Posidoniimonas polymericola]
MLKKFSRSSSAPAQDAPVADLPTRRTFWSIFLPAIGTFTLMLMLTLTLANGHGHTPSDTYPVWAAQHLLTTPLTLMAGGILMPITLNYMAGLAVHLAAWSVFVLSLRTGWLTQIVNGLRAIAPARAEIEYPQAMPHAA